MKIGFIGRSEIIYNSIKFFLDKNIKIGFVYTCKSESNYKKNEVDIKKLCGKNRIPYFCDTRINNKFDILKKFNVQIVFSVNYKIRLSDTLLKSFKHGVINIHLGDLPRYRGNATPNWAILNNEKKIPICFHKMSDKIDEGLIAKKIFFKLSKKTYVREIYEWTNKIVPKELFKLFKMFMKKKVKLKKQKGRPLIVFPRKDIDSKIDWKKSTSDIFNLVRASSIPFKGAYCFFEKKKLRIFECKIYKPNYEFFAIPGQVCLVKNSNPVIATGNGMIEITKFSYTKSIDLRIKTMVTKSLRNRLN